MARRTLSTAAVAALLAACTGGGASTPPPAAAGRAEPAFLERARETGLDFVHANGMTGRHLEAEIFAPGVALFDADNDGDLDVYLVQGRTLGAPPTAQDTSLRDRLFRNELRRDGSGRPLLRFTDMTAQSDIDLRSYGMGVAAGDYNNDGWTDLYVLRLGANALLRNNGNGTFTDAARASGTDDPGSWSVSASFVDFDRDGWLDLYVANYLSYRVDADVDCSSQSGAPDYCDPRVYQPGRDRLFRNERNGRFSDVTARALAGGPHGAALGVVGGDFDNDGWMDLYVANDRRENDLWINQRNGTFRNTALVAGAALSADGRAEGSMGVDAADFDEDGDEDLFITNFTSEGHVLYVNRGDATFEDRGASSGLRPASLPYTGFGTAWIDFDSDGRLDLLTVNGAVQTIDALARAGDPLPLRQRKQLFRNAGNERFDDVTAAAGPAFETAAVGRGAAFGDIDNDGDMDVVIGNNGGAVELLINEARGERHWMGLQLRGSSGGAAPGARVAVIRPGSTLWRRSRADGSYASANDPRLLVGLGDRTDRPIVRVTWPDGATEEWRNVPIDDWTTLQQGSAR